MSDSIPLKRCPACEQDIPATTEFFYIDRTAHCLHTPCIQCHKVAYRMKHPPKAQEQIPDGQKRCTKCGKVKPATLEFFHPRTNRKAVLTSHCKQCRNTARATTRTETPDVYHKESERKRYQARKSILLKQRFVYYREHVGEYQHYYQHYRKTHREQGRVYGHNRRARARRAPGSHTPKHVREQYDRQKGTCYYCQQKIEWGKHHVDHAVPLSRGGTNWPDNLVIACPTCNMKKHDKLPHEWPEGGHLF